MNAEELVSQEAVSPQLHSIGNHFVNNFSPLCAFKCVLKWPAHWAAGYIFTLHCLHLFYLSPVCLHSLAKRSQGIAPSCQFWLFRLKSANTVLYEGTFFHFMVYHSYPSKLNAGKYKVQCRSANWRWNDVSGPVAHFTIALSHFVQLSHTRHIIIWIKSATFVASTIPHLWVTWVMEYVSRWSYWISVDQRPTIQYWNKNKSPEIKYTKF